MVRGTSSVIREPFKEASLHKGEPALLFSDPEVADLSSPLRFVLIGKFISDRPSMEFIRRGFKTIGFKGDFRLGLLDPRHILIRFDLEDDYHRCWLHNSWRFKDHVMKVLKWTPEFSAKEEPPIVPVWVSFDQLPLFLFARSPLFSLGRILGTPLKLNAATLSLSPLSVARICVELDLQNSLPSRIWIGLGHSGFWQPVTYENLPEYCFDCHSLGHSQPDCGQQISLAPKAKQIWRVKPTSQPTSSQPPQVALVQPPPPIDSLVQDALHTPSAHLDVPATDLTPIGVVHVHGTVGDQFGSVHPQCSKSTIAEKAFQSVPSVHEAEHVQIPMDVSETDPTEVLPQISSQVPVVSSVCLPPLVSPLALPASASGLSPGALAPVMSATDAAVGCLTTVTADALIDGELCSASFDSDHEHHHSNPTSQIIHPRPRKPYSKRHFGKSSMVTRSTVPSLPLND